MPIIPNRSLKHNPFEYLGKRKRKHDFLELEYPGVPKHALLDFVRNKHIRANAEENLSVREITEKYKNQITGIRLGW